MIIKNTILYIKLANISPVNAKNKKNIAVYKNTIGNKRDSWSEKERLEKENVGKS